MASYITLAILAAFAYAFANLTTKFSSKHAITDQPVLLFYYYLTALPFILLVPLVFNVELPSSEAWFWVWLYGCAFFVANILSILAIYRFDASTFSAFTQLRPAFAALLAFWFLGERFPGLHYVFMGLMLVGALLTAFDERLRLRKMFSWNLGIIITLQGIHALAFLLAGVALKGMNPPSILFWGNLISCLFALALIPWLRQRLQVRFSQIKPMLVSGFFTVASLGLLFTAFQNSLTISLAISNFLVPIIVLALTFLASLFRPQLLEHHRPQVYLVRALGIALILFGTLQLTLS